MKKLLAIIVTALVLSGCMTANMLEKVNGGSLIMSGNSNVVNCYTDHDYGAWTASGGKEVTGQFFYAVS